MSGPCVSVLLNRSLQSDEREWLENLVGDISVSKNGRLSAGEVLSFEIIGESSLGGRSEEDALPFQMSLCRCADEYERDELDRIALALGWSPNQEVVLVAFTRRDASNLIVATLASRIARQFEGVVNLSSLVTPEGRTWRGAPPEEMRRFAASIPGMILEVSAAIGERQAPSFHLIDADYLDAWSRRKDFWLV
jgi:hypothetical protein